MGIESGISLITAALDLQLVRLLRAATADDAMLAARVRCRHETQPEIRPRPVHEPQARFEPRPVVHPQPRFEPRPVASPAPAEPLPTPASPDHAPCRGKLTIEPVWKILPAENSSESAQTVKVFIHRPDIISKGSLIDLFI